MSIDVTQLRPGVTILLDSQVFVVLSYDHIKMGRGGAIVRVKLRNLKSGATIERTFKSNDAVESAHVERKNMQYLYSSQDEYHFMDQESFEQVALSGVQIGELAKYLKEGFVASVIQYQGSILGVEIPASVELKVAETGPGFRGDTVSGGAKPATLETGAVIQVPLFINSGDTIKVDTRTGKYVERV